MIGAVESMSQEQKPDSSYGLDIEIEDYSFTGTIISTGSGGNNYWRLYRCSSSNRYVIRTQIIPRQSLVQALQLFITLLI